MTCVKTFILITTIISSLPRIVEPENDADRIAAGQSDHAALEYDTTLVAASTSSFKKHQPMATSTPKPSAISTPSRQRPRPSPSRQRLRFTGRQRPRPA